MREIKFRAWDAVNKKIIGPFQVGSSLSEIWPPQMQYTGLKDRTGKEIYEGDIIERGAFGIITKFPAERNIVTWLDSEAMFHITPGNESLWLEDIEIIGNIYENPELLKK